MPTTDGYGQGIQIAALTDQPDAAALARNLAGMVPQTVMRFASASARNAALTSPVAGMTAWLTAEKRMTYYDGAQWIIQSPAVFAYASAGQSFAHNVNGTLNINTVTLDDYSGFNTSAHYYVIPIAGVWEINAMVSWDASTVGWRTMWVTNSSGVITASQTGQTGTASGVQLRSHCITTLAAGQQISLIGLQQSGGSLSTIASASAAASLSLKFLHA